LLVVSGPLDGAIRKEPLNGGFGPQHPRPFLVQSLEQPSSFGYTAFMSGLLIIVLIVAVLWAGSAFVKRLNKP